MSLMKSIGLENWDIKVLNSKNLLEEVSIKIDQIKNLI